MLPIIAGIVSSLISNNLPKLAQAVTDKGLEYVEGKLGVKLEPQMSPEKIAEVQAAAQKHEEFLVEESNKNTADARMMQVEALRQEDVFSKRFVAYMSIFWSVFACAYIAAVTFMNIPPENVRIVDQMLGFLTASLLGSIINFWVGSSYGSKKKDDVKL